MAYILLRMKRFCGFITGFVFFLSGIVKLLDPVGAGLVMDSYFDFLHIGFMGPTSKFFGVMFALAETVIGTGLITGVWRKPMGLAALILQGFFTVLTLFLVIFNPEMDCGCFGEAIHLTHMQTFLKNIVLCILLATYYFPSSMLGRNRKRKYASFGLVTVSVLAFTVYSLLYIPLIDFTAFKPAAVLAAGENAEADLYEAVFIYEKDGVKENFTLGHLPDSTWTFVSTETVMKEGHEDSSVNLSIRDAYGDYHDSMAAEGKVLIVSVYDIDRKKGRWAQTARFLDNAEKAGFRPLLLVSSTAGQFAEMTAGLEPQTAAVLDRMVHYSDYKTLITMNRSNGGATFFCDGYLIRKYARRALPDMGELSTLFQSDETEELISRSTSGDLTFQGFLLYVFAVMLLL
ncbi:MAG: hypothetical protein IJN26_06360 [Bacteroidales bacterium]|nr:hypothetical protein [Bacteroidales bacterium]